MPRPVTQIVDAQLPALQRRAEPLDDVLLAKFRLCLQLPRYSELDLRREEVVSAEIDRVLARIRADQAPFRDELAKLSSLRNRLRLSDLHTEQVPARVAEAVHRCFHYIGWVHEGIHFGLYERFADTSSALPLCLLTFSPFDLARVRPLLTEQVHDSQILVLSRVYAFREAPKDAFSYALSRATRLVDGWLERPKLLLTYVNPNLGFQATSYRASNWALFHRDEALQYTYVDGEYVTTRALRRLFGTSDYGELRQFLGERLERSRMPLEPLELWSLRLR